MDTKKVLQQLIKIADSQQKIINKLAQALPPDSLPTSGVSYTPGQPAPAASESPEQKLKPAPVPHHDLQSLVLAANPKLGGAVASVTYGNPGHINVSFKPGQATQPNYDAVLATVRQLESSQKIPGSHKVHVA